jgi:hypothetical protein
VEEDEDEDLEAPTAEGALARLKRQYEQAVSIALLAQVTSAPVLHVAVFRAVFHSQRAFQGARLRQNLCRFEGVEQGAARLKRQYEQAVSIALLNEQVIYVHGATVLLSPRAFQVPCLVVLQAVAAC